MPAPHPRMHGITHVLGGPDPVPGLLPRTGDTLDDTILAAADAFWKLDETTGDTAHDSTGNGHTLKAGGGYLPPTWGRPAGPPGATSAGWVDNTTRLASAPPLDALADYSDDFTCGVWVNMHTLPLSIYEIIGQGQSRHSADGWGIFAFASPAKFALYVNDDTLYANNEYNLDTWYMVAVVRDAGSWRLYIDGLLQTATIGDDPGGGYGGNTWLGNDAYASHTSYLQDTDLSYAFIAARVMSGAELQDIVDLADLSGPGSVGGGVVAGGPGSVLGLDPDGNPAWVKPPGAGGDRERQQAGRSIDAEANPAGTPAAGHRPGDRADDRPAVHLRRLDVRCAAEDVDDHSFHDPFDGADVGQDRCQRLGGDPRRRPRTPAAGCMRTRRTRFRSRTTSRSSPRRWGRSACGSTTRQWRAPPPIGRCGSSRPPTRKP